MSKIKNISIIQVPPVNREDISVKFPVYWYYLKYEINKNNSKHSFLKSAPYKSLVLGV